MFDDEDKLSPRLEDLPQQASPVPDRKAKSYRGAQSTPNVHAATAYNNSSNNNNRFNGSGGTKTEPTDSQKYQTKYLSQVTTMVNVDNNQPAAKTNPSSYQSRVEPPIEASTDSGSLHQAPPPSSLYSSAPVVNKRPVTKSTSDDSVASPRSYGNPISTSGVVMRKKNPSTATK